MCYLLMSQPRLPGCHGDCRTSAHSTANRGHPCSHRSVSIATLDLVSRDSVGILTEEWCQCSVVAMCPGANKQQEVGVREGVVKTEGLTKRTPQRDLE